MTVKTTFRIFCISLICLLGAASFLRISDTINAQVNTQQLATTETDIEETDAQATEESLEETAEKSIEQVKKYLDPSRVQGVLNEMFSTHHGMVGEIQRINDDALTFENKQGTTILAIDENDVTITEKGVTKKLKDLAVGNWITILGYQESDEFTPKFIFVSESTIRPATQKVLLGMITEISSKKVTILDRSTQEELTFVFKKTSDVQDVTGEDASILDFQEDVNVLVVATTTDEEKDFEIVTLRSLASLNELN